MADGKVKIDIEADSSDFQSEIDGLDDKASKAGGGLDNMADGADKAAEKLGAVDVAAGNFITGALQGIISGVGDAAGALLALADSTRDYREDMAKLDTAFSTTGHSTETATGLYEDFYAILGESDRSVEAVNHLAEFTKSEKDLSKWSTIAAGVTAKFGDSLPIEGLTEAANETAKVGQVTGPLADALNWAGISEDEFNEKLAACSTEQERATLITETLNNEYKAAADEYNELTASTQEARRATSQMEEAQANLGSAIEPVTTAWTNLKANALEAILPVVETVAGWIQNLTTWLGEHETAATIITAVIIALAAAFGVLAAAFGISALIQTVTTAFAGLNLTMLANPITLIIAAIAALVAAFLVLWNNCEGFRNFWIGVWDAIKAAAAAVADWFNETWPVVVSFLQDAWSGVTGFFSDIWEGIKNIFSVVGEWFSQKFQEAKDAITVIWDAVSPYFEVVWNAIKEIFSVVKTYFQGAFSTAWTAIKAVWNTVSGYFSAVWNTIKGIFAVVKAVLSGNWSAAWSAIKGIVGTWSSYFSGVWTSIKSVFSAVASWFGSTFSSAKSAITNIWNSISGYFKSVYSKITGAFDSIFTDFSSVGSNIIDGIWAGISAGWSWLTGMVSSVAKSLFTAAKSTLGIKSPSREFAYLGEMTVEGMVKGIESNADSAVNAIRALGDSMFTAMDLEMVEVATATTEQLENMTDAEKDFCSKSEQLWNTHADKVKDLYQNYASTYESTVKQVKNSLGLFDMAERNEASGADLTAALRSQVDMMQGYQDALASLAGRGVGADFMAELGELGVNATGEIEALNAMTDEELTQYVELWREKTRLANDIAYNQLDDLRFDIIDEIDALTQEVTDTLKNMLAEMGISIGSMGEGAISDALLNNPELTALVQASVDNSNAVTGATMGKTDTGIVDLAQAVGIQTAGINSLSAQYNQGTTNARTVVLELNGRELGRALVDVGGAEQTRTGVVLSARA